MHLPNEAAPPQKMILPPVFHLSDCQYRIVNLKRTGEGGGMRIDLMHPLFPLIIAVPFDRLVFANFLKECQEEMAFAPEDPTETSDEGN